MVARSGFCVFLQLNDADYPHELFNYQERRIATDTPSIFGAVRDKRLNNILEDLPKVRRYFSPQGSSRVPRGGSVV
jgi:hypothetical protein